MNLPAVAEIDFLPADFHARRLQRRSRNWRRGVAAAFLLLMGLGLLGNQIQRARLISESERLRPQAEAVGDLERELAAVHAQIETIGLQARLRSRLHLTPATTRLLAAATAPMPADLAMTEFHVGSDQPPDSGALSLPGAARDEAGPPVRRDLDRLVGGSQLRRLLVTVRGVARNDAVVSDYLARLRDVGLFDEVRLLVTDRYEFHGYEMRSFAVQLRVRPPLSADRTTTAALQTAAGEEGAT